MSVSKVRPLTASRQVLRVVPTTTDQPRGGLRRDPSRPVGRNLRVFVSEGEYRIWRAGAWGPWQRGVSEKPEPPWIG